MKYNVGSYVFFYTKDLRNFHLGKIVGTSESYTLGGRPIVRLSIIREDDRSLYYKDVKDVIPHTGLLKDLYEV